MKQQNSMHELSKKCLLITYWRATLCHNVIVDDQHLAIIYGCLVCWSVSLLYLTWKTGIKVQYISLFGVIHKKWQGYGHCSTWWLLCIIKLLTRDVQLGLFTLIVLIVLKLKDDVTNTFWLSQCIAWKLMFTWMFLTL